VAQPGKKRPPPNAVGKRVVTEEQYRVLVAEYMLHPGQHATVAKLAQLNYRTCKKAWEEGLAYPYARQPLRDLVTKTSADLLAMDQLERETVAAETGQPVAGPQRGPDGRISVSPDELSQIVVQNGIAQLTRTRLEEMKLLNGTRANAHLGQKLMATLDRPLERLAARIAAGIDEACKANEEGQPLSFSDGIRDALLIFRTAVEMGKTQAATTKLTVESGGVVLRDLRTSLATGDAFAKKEDEGGDEDVEDEAALFARLEEDERDVPKRRARLEARFRRGSGQAPPPAQHEGEPPAPPGPNTEVDDAASADVDDGEDDGET